jgi:uncharacterized iron-regulated membrane protein
MLSPQTVRTWCWIHKWSSLVCTAFLLLLCVTGLPLVFHDEISELLGKEVHVPELPADTPKVSLDRIVASATAARPGEVVKYMFWDPEKPNAVTMTLAHSVDSGPEDHHVVVVDERTALVLGQPRLQEGPLHILLKLHMDMFADLPGKLFLGFMGLLFVVAVISGIVVYGPFMRRLDFGAVRTGKSSRLKWLDLHNLLGVVTVTWALVVGFTGVINTWSEPILKFWQFNQLAEMAAPFRGKPPVTTPSSVESAVAVARTAASGMTLSLIAYPGTKLTTNGHYAVFMRGATPLTSRLRSPLLINAETGELAGKRDLPWYVTALLLSQPLHFGDYGGMPLKIIWALLDLVTIFILGSGLYLWIARSRSPVELPRSSRTVEIGLMSRASQERLS